MILSLAIIINVTLAIALIAGLAYAMSRTTLLTPHAATDTPTAARPAPFAPAPAARTRRQSARVALAGARS